MEKPFSCSGHKQADDDDNYSSSARELCLHHLLSVDDNTLIDYRTYQNIRRLPYLVVERLKKN